ncbi:HD-GYP domain-containing protein [Minwuia sp.]|uniref:HD-GYP domain-containing protein n=1 Tax=Minwuia sp. TaxID=2493630 RepID=UPI003A958FE5
MTDAVATGPADPIRRERRSIRRRAFLALATLIGISVAAMAGILIYADNESDRLRAEWEVRLGIVADSRVAAVEGWLNQRRREVASLASNRAVQFFLIDRADPDVPSEAVDSRLIYVEDLLVGEAVRAGYEGASGDDRTPGGFVLLDADSNPVARTMDQDPPVLAFPKDGNRRRIATAPAFRSADGQAMVAFRAPVMPSEGVTSDPIGYVVGIRALDARFFDLLRQPGDLAGDAAVLLLQGIGDSVVQVDTGLSEIGTPRKSVTQLAGRAGGFGEFTGPAGKRVLAVSRVLNDPEWTLIRMIGRNEALSGGERRIWLMAGVLLLAVLLGAAAVVAVWKHAISDRLASAASDLSVALRESDRLSHLLQRLTDAVPNGILAVDPSDRILFGNRAALKATGLDADEAEGKDLIGVFGPGRAGPLLTANDEARQTRETIKHLDDRHETDGRHVVLRSHVPLDGDSVLLVSEDMTEVVVEREARSAQLDSLVNVLVDLIDARDTYAAHHSRRVATLSRAMAEQMRLDSTEVMAAETAARLMNLGKLRIDPELLTKTGNLTVEERALIRDSILVSADLVDAVSFDGPVVQTLRQMQERLDGSGRPQGLKGAEFIVTAQIVSLANAYIALISERAHRAAFSSEDAIEQLWSQAGTVWDRSVVAALVQAVEQSDGHEA